MPSDESQKKSCVDEVDKMDKEEKKKKGGKRKISLRSPSKWLMSPFGDAKPPVGRQELDGVQVGELEGSRPEVKEDVVKRVELG